MSHTPPNPGVTTNLPTYARKLPLVAIGGDAGRLEGCILTVVSAGGSSVRWEVFEGDELPPDFAPRLLHIQAYEALLKGDLDMDGAIVFGGRRYLLTDAWQSGRLVAVLTELRPLT